MDKFNEELIAAVRRWQESPWVHPLTCGNDSGHNLLEPEEHGREVRLRCPDCDYRQVIHSSLADTLLWSRNL